MFPADNFRSYYADVKTLLTVTASKEWNSNVVSVSAVNEKNERGPGGVV
jgi:hypothetical protein